MRYRQASVPAGAARTQAASSSPTRSSALCHAGVARTRTAASPSSSSAPARACGGRRLAREQAVQARAVLRGDGVPRQRPRRRGAGAAAARALLGAGGGGVEQELGEVVGVGLEHPRRGGADRPGRRARPAAAALRADAPPGLGRAELVGRAAAGDDHRQAAGHRLEHRHGEALAAVGVHEHVAGAVQRGHLLARQVVLEEHDARQRAGGGVRAQPSRSVSCRRPPRRSP